MIASILRTLVSRIRGPIKKTDVPPLELTPLRTYQDYLDLLNTPAYRDKIKQIRRIERDLIKSSPLFTVPGYCVVCGKNRKFMVDFKYASVIDGRKVPNWRERLVCPWCHLNNRQRAAFHAFHSCCDTEESTLLYMTEQSTALYSIFSTIYSHTLGSEYLGDGVPFGSNNKKGLRNETLCGLSFAENQFDSILSFDVLEHIPEYQKALSECYRCLRPGGRLLFSVPFEIREKNNLVRARVSEKNEIEHLLEAEYHGDPVRETGCLCFYHFGWELLDALRDMGYKKVNALLYWSQEYAYLGGEQLLFIAQKSKLG